VIASVRLYVVRHAETAWSLSGQYTGVTDLSLTPEGERMSIELAAPLAAIQFSAVLMSPRLRARRTCELAGLSARAQIDDDLAEWDYGDYEGMHTAQIRTLHPDWNIWSDGCPGGELPAQVSQRADRLLARLLPWHGNVALFTHGQFARVMAARWIGLRGEQGQHLTLRPASVSVLDFDVDHPERSVISLWNSTPASRAISG
jgi:probable phosphoglycerate mutase